MKRKSDVPRIFMVKRKKNCFFVGFYRFDAYFAYAYYMLILIDITKGHQNLYVSTKCSIIWPVL